MIRGWRRRPDFCAANQRNLAVSCDPSPTPNLQPLIPARPTRLLVTRHSSLVTTLMPAVRNAPDLTPQRAALRLLLARELPGLNYGATHGWRAREKRKRRSDFLTYPAMKSTVIAVCLPIHVSLHAVAASEINTWITRPEVIPMVTRKRRPSRSGCSPDRAFGTRKTVV